MRSVSIILFFFFNASGVMGQERFNRLLDAEDDIGERGSRIIVLSEGYAIGSEKAYQTVLPNIIASKIRFQKTDLSGTVILDNEYLEFPPVAGKISDMIKTDFGYLILSGNSTQSTENIYYLLAINELGDSLWSQEYGTVESDIPRTVIQTDDGGFIIVGTSRGFGNPLHSIYVVKTDVDGNLEWEQDYGPLTDDNEAWDVLQTEDSGFLISGHREGNNDDWPHHYLMKIDENGIFEWDEWYKDEIGSTSGTLIELSDGYLMAGLHIVEEINPPFFIDQDAFIRKIDFAGNTLWTKSYGQSKTGEWTDVFLDGLVLESGELVLCGVYEGEEIAWLVKLDSSGDMIWQRFYERSSSSDFFYDVEQTPDGGFIIVGNAREEGQDTDVWLVKTDEFGCDTMGCEIFDSVNELQPIPGLSIYPNPAVEHIAIQFPAIALNIQIDIIDVLGRVHYSEFQEVIQSNHTINVSHLPSGVYFIRTTVDDMYQEVGKIIKR